MSRGFGQSSGRTPKSSATAKAAEVFYLAFAHHRLGRLEEAIAHYRQALQLAPDYTDAHFALGVALQAKGGLDEAGRHLQKTLKLNPNHVDAHFTLSTVLQAQGKHDEAVRHLQKALRLRPDHAKAHNNLGVLFKEQGRLDEAVLHYCEALRFEPDFADAHNNLGIALKGQGKFNEAILHYRQSLRSQPDAAETHYNLGLALQATGNLSEALESYQNALQQLEFAEAHFGVGSVLKDQGRFDEAAASYRQALQLRPDFAEAQHYLAVVGGVPLPDAASPEYVTMLFDGYAERFDHHLTETLSYRTPEFLHRAVVAVMARDQLLKVMDLGCGTGLCGSLFRPLAHTLIGVDLSAQMVDKARSRAVYDHLIVGDMQTCLLAAQSGFDLILAADVFVYVGHLLPIFQASFAALCEGGHFAFSVEAVEDEPYTLLPNGRFAHSIAYVRQTSIAAGFAEVSVESAVLRTENARPIRGHIVLLCRMA
ncbi:MAG: tetratricopeptide repeat protein [Gemmatimonadaceae bacterium]|nr:tetratricopeptide repeat protein [Gloeobacterales cyanobacterium ES-bin-141]